VNVREPDSPISLRSSRTVFRACARAFSLTAVSFSLDASRSARGALVAECPPIARVARGRVHHDEIRGPTTKSTSRGVFAAPGAF
jgi:hypothetical protein